VLLYDLQEVPLAGLWLPLGHLVTRNHESSIVMVGWYIITASHRYTPDDGASDSGQE